MLSQPELTLPAVSSKTDTSSTDDLDDFGQYIDFRETPKQISGGQLWSTNVSLSYSYNASNPINITKTLWANTNTTIQATPNWRIQHNARFNLVNKSLVSHSFDSLSLDCEENCISTNGKIVAYH